MDSGSEKSIFKRIEFFFLDPKPSDLIMDRLKSSKKWWRILLVSVAKEWDDL